MTRRNVLSEATHLVTGSGGFLGSHLVDHLLDAGGEVHAIRHSEPATAPDSENLNQYVGDVADSSFVESCFETASPDLVYHLAAQTSTAPRIEETNVIGTRNISEASTSADVDGVVYASSAKRYADSNRKKSVTSPIDTPNRYSATKRSGELVCRAYNETAGLPVAIAVPFLVYGPGQRNGGLVHSVTRAALGDESITIRCSEHVRDPVFVEDAVEAFAKGAAALTENDWLEFNVCSGRAMTVEEIARSIYDTVETEARPILEQRTACREELGYLVGEQSSDSFDWTPDVSWREGISRTIAWYRE